MPYGQASMCFAKKVNCPKIPEICLIPYQKHKCIHVIKHHNKIQRDMSRKH